MFLVKQKNELMFDFYLFLFYNQINKPDKEFVMEGNLTDKQKQVLEFIRKSLKERGYPPTVREICKGIGVSSTSTVHGYLARLEKKNYIQRESTKNRSIVIVDDSPSDSNVLSYSADVANIPIVGTVTAGEPILAVENIEDHFPIPIQKIGQGVHFMLQISGDSMIEAGIFDGDYVLVREQNDARNGDFVVALIDDSATVKTFYREKDHIRLQPENPALLPIRVKSVSILGIVKGVFRFV